MVIGGGGERKKERKKKREERENKDRVAKKSRVPLRGEDRISLIEDFFPFF